MNDLQIIVEGTLKLVGLRNELYGRLSGKSKNREDSWVWLATMGDVDLDEDTGQFIYYDPNDDSFLDEVYGFEFVSAEKEAAEQLWAARENVLPADTPRRGKSKMFKSEDS